MNSKRLSRPCTTVSCQKKNLKSKHAPDLLLAACRIAPVSKQLDEIIRTQNAVPT